MRRSSLVLVLLWTDIDCQRGCHASVAADNTRVLDWRTVKANNARRQQYSSDARALQSKLVRFPCMKSRKLKTIVLVLSFMLVALPFVVAHSAGGRIEGRVTDPKGAV